MIQCFLKTQQLHYKRKHLKKYEETNTDAINAGYACVDLIKCDKTRMKKQRLDPIAHTSFGEHDPIRNKANFLRQGSQIKEPRKRYNRERQFCAENVLDNAKVHQGSPAVSFFQN